MRWPRSAWHTLKGLVRSCNRYRLELRPDELAALWQVVVSCPNERKERLWLESPHLKSAFGRAFAKLNRALDAEAQARSKGAL